MLRLKLKDICAFNFDCRAANLFMLLAAALPKNHMCHVSLITFNGFVNNEKAWVALLKNLDSL